MAFVLPFLLFVYFGLLDLTGYVSFNRKITSVASALGDLTGQSRNTIIKSEISDFMYSVNLIMKPTPANKVSVNLYGFRNVSGTVVQVWKTGNGAGPGCATTPQKTKMASLMTAGNDLVVAQACMTYTPYVATFMGQKIMGKTSFSVEQIVMVRPRSSLKLDCYTTAAMTTLCT